MRRCREGLKVEDSESRAEEIKGGVEGEVGRGVREEWEGEEEYRTESMREGLGRRRRRKRRREKKREQTEQMWKVVKYVWRKRWKREEVEQVHDSKVEFLKPLARIWQNPN